ncbi:uncharacterized protein LOC125238221 [Leguminivora glycinivorella]|uniref:uncharacterized protein LOC125238221 n=1 Tax=Leguminivora glycinivorella TaxID=1035111 RepID=UPI00200FDA40|nr:uncharacterized protein LOC125238221 [Leguminivora glycinivorella]
MPIKTKGKIYKSVVRPAMLYDTECWTTNKVHENRLHVNEMKMLRWAGGVTRLDKVRNDYIRGTFKTASITDKLKEGRLRWFGHVMRREDTHTVRKVLDTPNPSRGRGRPPASWWSNVQRDLKQLSPTTTTRDRASWRRAIRRPDPN